MSHSKNHYKVRWNYYKLRQLSLLQSAMDFTNCDSFFITKCDTVYYKLRQVLQSVMIITNCDSTLGGNWRGSYSWGYKEYNAITMYTSLSEWHQLAHKIHWGSSIAFFIPVFPSPNFVQSRNLDDFLFWYPTSRDTFNPKSRPDFALKSWIPRFK